MRTKRITRLPEQRTEPERAGSAWAGLGVMVTVLVLGGLLLQLVP